MRRRRRRRGAAPCPANIFPGRRGRQTAARPCAGGPMIFVCPQGLRRRKVQGTMQASSPTQHGSMLCRILQDTPCAKRQCTPQSASPPPPLAGEPMGRLPPIKPPLQGEVDAPQAQTEGCGALPRKYLSGSPEASDRRTPAAAAPKYSKNPPPAGACLAGGGAVYAFGYGAFFPHGQALTERP